MCWTALNDGINSPQTKRTVGVRCRKFCRQQKCFVIRSSRRAAVDVSKRPGHSVAAEARVISDRTSVRVFAASALKKNLSFLFSFKTLTKDEICLAV